MRTAFSAVLFLALLFAPRAAQAYEGTFTGVYRTSGGEKFVLKMKVKRHASTYSVTGRVYVPGAGRAAGAVGIFAAFDPAANFLDGNTLEVPPGDVHGDYDPETRRFELDIDVYDPESPVPFRYHFSCKCRKNCKPPPRVCGERRNARLVRAARQKCLPPTPTPAPQYYIYDAVNCGDTLFLALPEQLSGVKLCSVTGCGTDCGAAVQFSGPLAGPYGSLQDAQKGLCSFLSAKHTNQLVYWGPWVQWGAVWYRCFLSECQSALANYCPDLPYG